MHALKLTARLAAAGLLTLGLAGCQDLIDGVQSDYIAMAALVKTPDIAVPAPTQQDPGASRIEPGKTIFTLLFGKADRNKIVNDQASEGAFTPVVGAVVKLQYTDASGAAQDLGVTDAGEGKYLLESGASGLTYAADKDYVVVITYGGKTYRLKTKAPSAVEIAEFKNTSPLPKSVFSHAPGSNFTLTRAETSAPAKRTIAFWGVQSASGAGASLGLDSVFAATNVPSDALGVLKFLLNDAPFREKAFTVPGATFAADSDYLAVMASIEHGGDAGGAGDGSLFPVSSFLIGSADGGLISTKAAPAIPMP